MGVARRVFLVMQEASREPDSVETVLISLGRTVKKSVSAERIEMPRGIVDEDVLSERGP